MSARKKLNPAVGFGSSNKEKDDEQSTVLPTTLSPDKDIPLKTIQGTNYTNNLNSVVSSALSNVLDTNLNSTQDINYVSLHSDTMDGVNENIKVTQTKNVKGSNATTRGLKKDTGKQSSELDVTLDAIKNNAMDSILNKTLNSIQSSVLSSTMDTNQDTARNNSHVATLNNVQNTNKMTFQIPSKSEPFSKRLVANVTPSQKLFVQEMSKRFENESSFVRFMISKFIESIEIEGGEQEIK